MSSLAIAVVPGAPEKERERAAVTALARAAAGTPIEQRAALTKWLLSDGVWGAISRLGRAPSGKLAGIARRLPADDGTAWLEHEMAVNAASAAAGIRAITRSDPDWPTALHDLGMNGPIALWVSGDISHLSRPTLAVVGSRQMSALGYTRVHKAVAMVQGTIVSGLAVGADGAAHRAALQHGRPTVAVLPSGLDVFYPSSHRQLAQMILDAGGALVTEYPAGTSAIRFRFLDRNRIIAALGQGTLIAEASMLSGTMNEARHARSLGRSVGAFVGTSGADWLISEGHAIAVHNRTDLESLYDVDDGLAI